MEVRGAAASDFEVEVQGDDRRGIGVTRRSFISDTPVFDNAGGSSPTGTTNSDPEKLRTPELPLSGLAPQGTQPEGSVVPGSKSVAAFPNPEAGDGQVRGGGDRHSFNFYT